MRLILCLLALSLSAPAVAQDVRTLAPGSAPPKASIVDLKWMTGHWVGEGLGGQSTETISPPVAGQMSGHFEQIKDGKLWFYELYQFVTAGESLVMRIKHFNADLTGWEEKERTVEFPLVAIEPGAVYFDGLTYRRTGDDTMESYVQIRQDDRSVETATFKFRRKGL